MFHVGGAETPSNSGGASSHVYSNHGSQHHKGKSADYCKCFNKGRCNLGRGCRYEHRCSYYNKFGHGVIVCRKLIYDREHKPAAKDKDNKEI